MRALRETQDAHLNELEHIEVALFEAPSRETLEHTHSRYFKTLSELGENLTLSDRRDSRE
jgi:hypothetical protein